MQADALVNILGGQGVSISACTLNCPAIAAGSFRVVSSNLGLDSGIVLTNGRAATINNIWGVNGPSGSLASTNDFFSGDPTLTALCGRQTYDACILEFDVIPQGDSLRFNYVFSSEEYISAVCGSYNDVFAFFISGPGISGSYNMALVPGTNIPVAINSINNGIPGSVGSLVNCTDMGPGSPFTTFYVDNSTGTTLTHKGFTTVLQAGHAVTRCGKYHLKMAIADAGNAIYDSGVFLEAGSLETNRYNIRAVVPGAEDSSGICVKGCAPGRFHIKRRQPVAQPETIKFMARGTAVSGIDYAPIGDSVVIPPYATGADIIINGLGTPVNGVRILQLAILSPVSCGIDNVLDSATIVIYDTLHIDMQTQDTAICLGDKVHIRVAGDDMLSYHWEPVTGLNSAGIKQPDASPGINTSYTVIATMPGTQCLAKTADVAIRVKPTPSTHLDADTTVCHNTALTLTPGSIAVSPAYSYQWSGPGGFTSTSFAATIDTVHGSSQGIYTLSVVNDTNGCKATATENVGVIDPPAPSVTTPVIFCQNTQPDSLKASGDGLRWYMPNSSKALPASPVPFTDELSESQYYVSQTIDNCASEKAEVEVSVRKCCDGVIIIPTAFTPNGDGRNDAFHVGIHYGYIMEHLYIYNRWGALVYSGTDGTWDGTYNGQPTDDGVYFYTLKLRCVLGGYEYRKGDITLIR
jgi:gliding motility-associated-like protein